ncbi:MAG: hypothetical protein ISF22_01030 [Methanomassiliicoccus sp.]|nr:hypothetical protein [Methanomassiliicoccus sp.]
MTIPQSPYGSIIEMARSIARSGLSGEKGSKAEAESIVREIIGPADQAFTGAHGVNYWTYLKQALVEYAGSRGLQGEFVVKGSPFNWHASVGTRCSAVLLRKDFHRGDAHVEPELFLEAGAMNYGLDGPVYGVACGFHYLPSPEGDASRFVQGVLEDREARLIAWALSNNGFVNPTFRSGEGSWGMGSALARMWPQDRLPSDLKEQAFRALDELLPLFKRIVSVR